MSKTTPGHDYAVSSVNKATETETTTRMFSEVIDGIATGRWREQVEKVREAYKKGGKAAADVYKKMLPAVMFSGTFAKRSADALQIPSGLICVDLDNLGPRLPSIREHIECDCHTVNCFTSPTETGLKVIFKCEPDRPHLESFRAAERYVLENFGLEVDAACKDVSRLCFVSYDPETFIARDAVVLPYPPARVEFVAPQESKPGARLLSGLTPGDDFDARGDLPALLLKHGWMKNGAYYWGRPGKEGGVSASWNKVPNRFFVFTSSTGFEANHTYKPWHVFSILECGGDWKKAAKELAALGYGEQRQKPTQSNGVKEVYDPGYEPGVSEGHNSDGPLAPDGPSPILDDWPEPISADELCANPPPKPPVLIEGMLYSVGTMLLAGPSKSHKTFSALDAAIAIASGTPWLGFKTTQATVLYLNLELQDFATEERISKISAARGGKPPTGLKIWNLRGRTVTLAALTARLPAMIKKYACTVVAIDPHYKVSAVSDMEENSNDNQGKLLTLMEGLCVNNGAALILTHHFAKGDSSSKNAIDRASGGGVFARWGDVMLTFTPHEEDDAMSVEMSLRNFAPVEPFVVRWVYPRWVRDGELDPAKLKTSRGPKEKCSPNSALHALGDKLMSFAEWEKACGFSNTTFKRKRQELIDSGQVEQVGPLYRKKVV